MSEFTIFQEIAEIEIPDAGPEAPWAIRPSVSILSTKTSILDTIEKADALVDDLYRSPIGAIAIDTEYRFASDPVDLGRGKHWYDISTLQPLILTGAAWLPGDNKVIQFLFDLRNPDILPALTRLLRMHTVFVMHNIKSEFLAFWSCGLDPVLPQVFDTYVAARALTLGIKPGNTAPPHVEKSATFEETEKIKARLASSLSLLGQCKHYGVHHPQAGTKSALQTSFLNYPENAPFSELQQKYALADAHTTLQIYLAQQGPVTAAGLHSHLHTVEFPYAVANARMEFDGVPVCLETIGRLRTGLMRAVDHHRGRLQADGIENPNSPKQVQDWLVANGFEEKIKRKGKLTTSDNVLEPLENASKTIKLIRRYRRYSRLLSDPLFSGYLIGSDGRLHPNHRHLGANTGRNTCSTPNIVGISKTFRPIVVAPPGRALIEADFAQIEVGVAAAEFKDPFLTAAFNEGDVYAGVARKFYWDDLSSDEQEMSVAAFRTARPDLRSKMKVFVLASLYGMQDQSIADRFGISLIEATRQRKAFLDRFPGIGQAMTSMPANGRITGFAPIVGGLRRIVPQSTKAANQHQNTPVQASAGVVFRKAVVDLYHQFRGTSIKLVLPIHDAVLVECDHDQISQVTEILNLTMIAAVRAYYPELQPRIDINAADPTCWNKDGQSDSIQRFEEDPEFKL